MSDNHRKRAPGKVENHPDWVLSLSGGIDSTAAAVITKDAIETIQADGNFAKKPFAIYLDTGIGNPINRIYTEQLSDWLDVQLWTLRTDESFLEWLRRDGAPGPGAHQEIRNELKERQVSLLTSKLDDPVYILGISADESDVRAGFDKVREKGRHTEVYPVHRLSRKERAEIIIRSDCPINPLWVHPSVISDCGCLAYGDPSELDKTEEEFPAFGNRLREYEEAIDHDGLRGNLGWGGLTPDQQESVEDGEGLTVCSDGCQRARNPSIVQAFEARIEGKSKEEAIEILYKFDKNGVVINSAADW